MQKSNHNDDEIITDINVTPLVDIMLVLLIIFMLVSTFVEINEIKVELPEAATGETANVKSLSISISKYNHCATKKSIKKTEIMSGKLIHSSLICLS